MTVSAASRQTMERPVANTMPQHVCWQGGDDTAERTTILPFKCEWAQ